MDAQCVDARTEPDRTRTAAEDFGERYPELANYIPELIITVGTCKDRHGEPTIWEAYEHIFDEHCERCWENEKGG